MSHRPVLPPERSSADVTYNDIDIYINMHPTAQFSLTDDQILSLLSPFRVQLSAGQIIKIREYIRLLLKWNQSVSLTSVVDPTEIVERHFGESMFVSSLLPVENCRLADVGSGPGFPGLAMKVVCPRLQVILIESNKRKCVFLAEVVRALELTDVEILPLRFAEIPASQDFAEIVTARALGGFPSLLHWAKTALARRGHVVLWLGGEDSTRVSAIPAWIWQPAVKIPESQRRFVLIGRPKPDKHLEPKD
jgi:16S rRNA (guanine527-N7)-methyltransferase